MAPLTPEEERHARNVRFIGIDGRELLGHTPEDRLKIAEIFELGVNVGPGTTQAILVEYHYPAEDD